MIFQQLKALIMITIDKTNDNEISMNFSFIYFIL